MDNWAELRERLTGPNRGVAEDAKKLRETTSRARDLRKIFSQARGLREIFLRTYLRYRTQSLELKPCKAKVPSS
ncbi:ABC transporter permease [Sesbania bispinosa]|nr:ABC transporter permease [Sesbania bispinosa]